jgi:hypothetical protein
VASSAFVYFDDGLRALAASHPIMALFFALGMSDPAFTAAKLPSSSRLPRNGLVGLIAAAGLFVCLPWIAHRFSSSGALTSANLVPEPTEAIVLSGRRMSGFIVVADDQPIREDVPSLHLATFDAILKQGSIESNQDLIHPVLPPLPFGFVFAPRAEKDSNSKLLYIVPPEVIEQRDVPAWHFDLKRWGDCHTMYCDYWSYVTKAEPWRPLDD